MRLTAGTRPYRIGWWTHQWWPRWTLVRCMIVGRQPDGQKARRVYYVRVLWRRLRSIQRPHRPWQSEAPEWCRFARRGLTPRAARRKMEADVLTFVQTGEHSRWQQRRAARR